MSTPLLKSLIDAQAVRYRGEPLAGDNTGVPVEKASDPPQDPNGFYIEVGGKASATMEDGTSITGEIKSVKGDSVTIAAGGKNFKVSAAEVSVTEGPEGSPPKDKLPIKEKDLSSKQKPKYKLMQKLWPDEETYELEGGDSGEVTVRLPSAGLAFDIAEDGTVTEHVEADQMEELPPEGDPAAGDIYLSRTKDLLMGKSGSALGALLTHPAVR